MNNMPHPLFDCLGKIDGLPNVNTIREGLELHPFYFDSSTIKPLDKKEAAIEIAFELWERNRPIIQQHFEARNRKEALIPMTKCVGLLLGILYWINDYSVPFGDDVINKVDQLQWKPVNSKERLVFLFQKPDHYHSFIQLTELFKEVKKLFYKSQVSTKKS